MRGKWVLHRADLQEKTAFERELNSWLAQGYRLNSVSKYSTRLAAGAPEAEAYVLGFDDSRPQVVNAFVDKPVYDGAVPVSGCPGLWLYPRGREPQTDEPWEKQALRHRWSFSKPEGRTARRRLLWTALLLFQLYTSYRMHRALSEAAGGTGLFFSASDLAVLALLAVILAVELATAALDRQVDRLHQRLLAEAAEQRRPYVLPEERRSLVYRKNWLHTAGALGALGLWVVCLCLILL